MTMPDGPRYDDDFFAWTQYQADVLRTMTVTDNRFDRENVAEEIETLGRSERDAVRSQVRRIIEHLLTLTYSPAEPPRIDWIETIDDARETLSDKLTATLRLDAEAALKKLYAGRTRFEAARRAGCRRAAAFGLPLFARRHLPRRLVPGAAWRKTMTRDFVGYGGDPPHAGWPGDARIAVNFVINFEEGSELSYPAGDGVSETMLTEMVGSDLGVRGRDLGAESMFEYGARVGFWRLHRIFTRFRQPLTIFGCARAFEANPPAAAAIAATDWDICSHGYRWTNHPGLAEDEERRQIAAAVDLIRQTTGKTPLGWYCRYAPSENTRRLVVEHGGFLYDSDTYNDELPYWVRVGDKPHLVVPYALTTNDSKFGRGVFGSGEDFFAFLRDSFDLLYEEGAESPRMMSVGLHMRLTGHPGRAKALIRFIEHILAHSHVWICRREDIARHWIARFPAAH
jgi:allantoinase